jgi:hypothetical protein
MLCGAGCMALAAAIAGPAIAQDAHVVTSAADSGEGSLRAALAAAANAESPAVIAILAEEDIAIESTLSYTGTAPLAIFGTGQTISSANNVTLLQSAEGADLYIRRLDFAGPGGFDMQARGDRDGPAGKGIFIDVREDQQGMVTLELESVSVTGTAGHGVHVSDCSLADDCGGGGGGAGEGSDASISVRLADVTIDGAARGSFDADGLRVDERGPGDILFSASGSAFTGVGADGVELDEGQAGDVIVRVTGSAFEVNGDYCDPGRLAQFMPDDPEGAFEQGAMAEADIPGPVTGSPDDACFEREVDTHDDGSVAEYEIGIDVDDGFDVDEAGPGSIRAVVEQTGIAGNFDEGLDFDEEGPGDISIALIGTTGIDNSDDAYKHSEEGAGSVSGVMIGATAQGNGGVGAVFEEEGDGDVRVMARGVTTVSNDDGETGLEVVQEDAGEGALMVMDSDIQDGIAAEGVAVTR